MATTVFVTEVPMLEPMMIGTADLTSSTGVKKDILYSIALQIGYACSPVNKVGGSCECLNITPIITSGSMIAIHRRVAEGREA